MAPLAYPRLEDGAYALPGTITEPGRVRGAYFGSGVLLQLKHRYFVLTAGHVLRLTPQSLLPGTLVAGGKSDDAHGRDHCVIEPNLAVARARDDGTTDGYDFGFVEISPTHTETLNRIGHSILTADSVFVADQKDDSWQDDALVASG